MIPPPYRIKVDPVTGLPLYDETKPLLTLKAGVAGELVFTDFFDYTVLCVNARRTISSTASDNFCTSCGTPDVDSSAGLDLADGFPISEAGSAVWQDQLCVYWGFIAQGTPVFGGFPLGLTMALLPGAAPVEVVGALKVAGAPPRLPGDLLPGTLTPGCGLGSPPGSTCPGTLGTPVYTTYRLSRPMTKGEYYKLSGRSDVVKSVAPAYPPNYPVYHSSPFDDTCAHYARDPNSAPTSEFL